MPPRRTGRRVAPVQARTTGDTVDLSPVLDPDPLDIRVSLASIVHFARRARHCVPARNDERSTLLALTPAGREIGQRIMRHAQASLDSTLLDWSPADVETLQYLLARLARETSSADWL